LKQVVYFPEIEQAVVTVAEFKAEELKQFVKLLT